MKAVRLVALVLLVVWASIARADVAIPPLTGRVVDQTGTLGAGDIASLTQTLKNLELRKGSQVAVLIVPTTQPETIEQFSIRAAEAWKIGRKKTDDGALLVVAKNDHRLRIEVGYGLEGALTDVTTKRIIDEEITPKFRTGDFAGGITAGVDRMIAVIDGEPLPAPASGARSENPDLGRYVDLFNPFIIFVFLAVAGVLRGALGRLMGSAAIGGVASVLVWLFYGSLAASAIAGSAAFVLAFVVDMFSQIGGPRGYRGSGWSGGGYSGGGGGWSSGSSSSDSGGFSGGGGSFGGGGASGSW